MVTSLDEGDLLPAPVDVDLNAVAVKLDLMKPLVTLRGLRLQRCKLGLNDPGISIRFGNNSTHKKSRLKRKRAFLRSSQDLEQSGTCFLPPPMLYGLLRKYSRLPSAFRILVDGDRDGLDVLVTVPFPRRELPDFRQRLNERRRVRFVLEVPHQLRPPNTLLFRGSSAFRRSRSAQRPSILSSIRCSSTSAEAVGTPARWRWRISLRCRTWVRMCSISERT